MMRSAEDLLQELISLDESHRIEAKRCTQVDKSVMETVCAYANEPGLGGGYLLLGVVRDEQDFFKNAYTVSGISNPDKIQSDLVSQCASVFNRPVRPRVSVEELNGKTVVVVANLAPIKLRGVESQGMLLAASKGERLRLVTVDGDLSSGAVVK